MKLALTAEPAIVLIDLDSTGHLNISSLSVELLKSAATEPNTVATSAWSISTTGAIVLTDVVDVRGSLTLAKQPDGTVSLTFLPDHALAHIPLPPDHTATMDLSFGEIAIVRHSNPDLVRTDWRFEADADVAFQGWHPTVHRYLPPIIATQFKADRQGIQLTADRVVNPFDYALPQFEIGDTSVQLGTANIDISDLFIRLGQEIAIAAQLGLGLPSKLNNLFETNPDGTPKLAFFNTFDPGDREHSVVKAELRIGIAGIEVVPTSSVIRAVSLTNDRGEPLQPGEDTWWLCDLQEFGAVKFKVPTFSYDTATSSFAASGAFDTVRCRYR